MRTKIVIHIGMHKTGTTFLQQEVFSKIPNINYQNKINLSTKVEEGKINLFSDENLDGGSYRLFAKNENRINILKNLHTLFPNAYIILCIRNKKTWLYSAYKQYIVAYKSCTFEEYKERLDKGFLDFDEYIKKLDKLWFDNVYVCHFEDLKRNPKQFVKGICDFIGVEPPKFKNKKVYKGITDGQVKFIRLYDKLLPSKIFHLPLAFAIKFIRKDSTITNWLRRKE